MKLAVALLIAGTAAHAAPEPPPLAPNAPFPFSGSTIPTNARIVFFGEPHDGIRFERIDRPLVLSFTQEPAGSEQTEEMFIVNPGALVPGELVLIEPSCPICDASEVFEFTVADILDDTPPEFVDGPVTQNQVLQAGTVSCLGISSVDGYGVSATLPPVVDSAGAVLVRTESTEGSLDHERADDPTQPVNVSFGAAPGPLREVCATVTAIDIAGNETVFDEPICGEVGGGGCAQSSTPALLAGLALFLRGRRRRSFYGGRGGPPYSIAGQRR